MVVTLPGAELMPWCWEHAHCWRGPGSFPEARNDASLWGCSWGSRKPVATGLLLPGALTTKLCGGHVIPEAHKQLGLAYFCSSEVTHVGGDQSGSQAVAKLAGTEPEPSCQMDVCALRLAQRRTPHSHRHPPSSLCNSRMICDRAPCNAWPP